jgi:ankyrin repeat protein
MNSDFFNAIKQGNLDEVRRFISLTSTLIHEREDGRSPIMVAAHHKQPQIADFLAEKTGNPTIFEAASIGKTNQIVRQIARDPELVNAYSDDGYQPLGLACFFGHYEAAEYLIKAGASINSHSRNALNAAPLHYAAMAGHVKIVALLLNNNADPNAREQGGLTPLHAAAQLGDSQMIRILLFNGANLNVHSLDGKTPVELAMEAGRKDVVGLLKEGITRRFRQSAPPPHS